MPQGTEPSPTLAVPRGWCKARGASEEPIPVGPGPAPDFVVRPIGHVESTLVDPAAAPKQGDEGAPPAWLVFDDQVGAGLGDLRPGEEILVLTWFHRARRDVLAVHPRDDLARPAKGVFATRSADRPNPIGIHRTAIVAVNGRRIRMAEIEAVDGTPIIDVKPVLDRFGER